MPKSTFNLLILVFFMLSGLTALVYEIVWEKYLTLFLGASAYSQVAVMCSFMLGLGIGSALFGRVAEKSKHHLIIYAILELSIGIYALFYPLILRFGERVYLNFINVDSPFTLVIITKFIISIMIMIFPSILMGGTLPILGKYLINSDHKFGSKLSILYFLNALGASLGCIIAGYYLISQHGLKVTTYFAAIVNIGMGLIVYLLRDRLNDDVKDIEESQAWSSNDKSILSRRLKLCLLLTIFLSGFASMMYEVIWIRVLSNVLGSTTYSFSLMLAVFILGIALGSLFVSRIIDRFKNIIPLVVVIEIFLILAICLSLPLINRLPYFFVKLSLFITHTGETFYVFSFLQALICALVMFPVSLFSGMILPALGVGLFRNGNGIGREIGSLYAANTFGTVLAVLITGLFILPKLGILGTIFVGLGVNLCIVVILIQFLQLKFRTRFVISGMVSIILFLMVTKIPEMNPNLFLASVFRHNITTDYESFSEFVKDSSQHYEIISYNEGITSTIVVTEEVSNGNRSLFINGKADASTSIYADLLTQSLVGIIPHLISPNNKRVLVVGMGTGTTAYTSSLPSTVEQVDVVEISEAVVETLPYFESVNKGLLSNPKVEIHIEDAKTFLALTKSEYDVIISEPTNTWISGIGNLFSTEYYHQVYNHLADDGVFVQWIQTYETSDDIILSAFYTLNRVFPYCDIWYSGKSDLVITCYKHKSLNFDFEYGENLFSEMKNSFLEFGIESLEEILLLHGANEQAITGVLSKYGAYENSDEMPYIEYEAPKQLFVKPKTLIPDEIDQRLKNRHQSLYPFFTYFEGKKAVDYFEYFDHYTFLSPITRQMKILKVMHEDIWFIDSPWSRKYSLNDLFRNYKGADSGTKKRWFLKEVYTEYKQLVNCFVEVPFKSFLQDEIANYLVEYPEDAEFRKIDNDLDSNKTSGHDSYLSNLRMRSSRVKK